MIFAKVVAVAKTIHKFIVYCHASLIALLPRNRYTLSVKARTKNLATASLYRLLGVCAFGAVVEYSMCGYRLDCHVAYFNAPRNDIWKNTIRVWVSHQLSFRGNEVTVGI